MSPNQTKKLVDTFFVALETQQFDLLKKIFAPHGKQFNPYAPEGFPKSFDGAEGIYKQYSGLTVNFGKMTLPERSMRRKIRTSFLYNSGAKSRSKRVANMKMIISALLS